MRQFEVGRTVSVESVRSPHLWLSNRVSVVPLAACVMLVVEEAEQVQTKQAVTTTMLLHHHSGTGALAQENSALIEQIRRPPSMTCLKTHWSGP